MSNDLTDFFNQELDKAYQELDEFVDDTLQQTWDSMAELISTSGAKPKWDNLEYWHKLQDEAGKPRRDGSTPGRVHTGHMLDSLGTEKTSDSRSRRTVGKVGWVQGWEEYFRLQEEGFINPITDDPVEGMNMLVKIDEMLDAIGDAWEKS